MIVSRIDTSDAIQLPAFSSLAEERQHRKERLAASFRLFSKFGFDEGVAGHITARDPELSDHFWVNAFGQHFGEICVSDLILVNHRGETVEGKGAANRAAFAIHSQIHEARPDVTAAAHAHSIYGKSWSSLGRLLDPITPDACASHHENAALTRTQLGTHEAGWFQFQPLWAKITREQPDLFH